MAQGIQNVSNFLGPAVGTMSAYMLNQSFNATPFFVDFNKVMLDGRDFRPSGVIIDNTQGAGDLIVLINEMSLRLVCPAGESLQLPFPSPLGVTANITGSGVATVIFVDYPVIPFTTAGGGAAIPNPLPITGALTDAQLRAAPLTVNVAETALTAALVTETGAGNTPGGMRMVSFQNIGGGAVTVAGGALPAGQTLTFEAPYGTTLNSISYSAVGSTLLIATLG